MIDETGIDGSYDITLEWTPEAGEGKMGFGMLPPPPPRPATGAAGPGGSPGEGGGKAPGAEGPDAPNIFTAIQEQLGLKLESRKGPMEMIVIDSMEKVPTEN